MLDLDLLQKFVINLKRRPDRLELFRTRCPLKDYTVIYGFDGKNINLESSARERNMIHKLTTLLPGEQGCFISHIRIFQKIVREKIPFAFIIEDDAFFSRDFTKRFLQVLNEVSHDVDILYIGGRFTSDFVMLKFLTVSQNIVKHIKPFEGDVDDRTTHAYIVSYKMAGLLVNTFYSLQNISIPIDHWILNMCMQNSIDIYNSNPLLCHSPAIGNSDVRARNKFSWRLAENSKYRKE